MQYTYELIRTDERLPIKMIIHTSDQPLEISRHWHESVEISYVLSGEIDQIYVDGVSYLSQQGDIVLINSNAIHSFSVSQGCGRIGVTVFIPQEFIRELVAEGEQVEFDCISIGEKNEQRLSSFGKLRETLNLLVTTYFYRENDSLSHVRITSLSYDLVYQLLKYFKKDKPIGHSFRTNKHLERLTAITNYIKEHYQENLSLAELASLFHLSPEYLSRFFVKHTGMTVYNYICAIRLEKAYPELMNTDHSVIDIALTHGFANEKSFNREFKRVYRTSPHQYRKALKQVGQDLAVFRLKLDEMN